MAPLRLPPADSSAGYEPGSTHDISLQALVLSPDVCQPSGGGPVAEARETACSPPRCPASKRKRDSLSDDGGGSAALGAPASAKIVPSYVHSTLMGSYASWHCCVGCIMSLSAAAISCATLRRQKCDSDDSTLVIDPHQLRLLVLQLRSIRAARRSTMCQMDIRARYSGCRCAAKRPLNAAKCAKSLAHRKDYRCACCGVISTIRAGTRTSDLLCILAQHEADKGLNTRLHNELVCTFLSCVIEARLQELMHEFAAAAHEMLLFTRNVRKVSVLIMEPGQQRAKLLGKVGDCCLFCQPKMSCKHQAHRETATNCGMNPACECTWLVCLCRSTATPGTSECRWSLMCVQAKQSQHSTDGRLRCLLTVTCRPMAL